MRDIERYSQLVDVYGVGTTITNAPVVDFSMDIIEVDGQAVAKRGDLLVPFFSQRHLEQSLPKPSQIREFVLQQLSKVEL